MKKKKAVTPPPVCELVQLELPLEPQNDESQPPSKLPQHPQQARLAETQAATIYADDRVGMTAFSFMHYTALFAVKLVEAYNAGRLPDEDAIRDFGLEYAQGVFKWNYKYHKY